MNRSLTLQYDINLNKNKYSIMKKSSDIKLKSHWLEILKPFSFAVKGEVIEAVYNYVTDGRVADSMSEIAAVAFAFIRHEIDRDAARKDAAAARRKQKSTTAHVVEDSAPVTQDQQQITPPAEPVDETTALPEPVPIPSFKLNNARLPRKLKKQLKRQIAARQQPSANKHRSRGQKGLLC